MKNFQQKLIKEREAFKKEKNQLIMPIMVLLTIIYNLMFGVADLSAHNFDFGNVLRQSQKAHSDVKWSLVDIDKLAYAVSEAETSNCRVGYGIQYNNCFGIKGGSIVKCKTGRNRMCIFNSKEESFDAFKKIWSKGYGGRYPTLLDAEYWTGKDNARDWLRIVNYYYNK